MECSPRRLKTSRRDELISNCNCWIRGDQERNELASFGDLNNLARLHLFQVAARVLTKLAHAYPGHFPNVA